LGTCPKLTCSQPPEFWKWPGGPWNLPEDAWEKLAKVAVSTKWQISQRCYLNLDWWTHFFIYPWLPQFQIAKLVQSHFWEPQYFLLPGRIFRFLGTPTHDRRNVAANAPASSANFGFKKHMENVMFYETIIFKCTLWDDSVELDLDFGSEEHSFRRLQKCWRAFFLHPWHRTSKKWDEKWGCPRAKTCLLIFFAIPICLQILHTRTWPLQKNKRD